MKTSLNFLRIALTAAGLIALVAPASAQAVGGSKCSTIREMDKKTQCLTRATDQIQDNEGKLKRDVERVNSFVKAFPPITTTEVITKNGPVTIYDGPTYRIVVGPTGVVAPSGNGRVLLRIGDRPPASRR